MEVIKDTKDFRIESPTAVTIGKFDGVHMGHKKLIGSCMRQREKGLKVCVFTFAPSPEKFFGAEERCLTTAAEKRRVFDELGVDYLVEYPFDKETADTEPEDFIKDILCGKIHAKYVAAGSDLSYGIRGEGDSKLLLDLRNKYDYEADIIDKVRINDEIVSSTAIREAIRKSDMEKATAFLGAPYQMTGVIVHGNRIGRTIGMPTINQIPDDEKLLPPFGVYYSEAEIEGKIFKGITNIGVKPTVSDEKKVTVETFLYNFNQDVYGNRAAVRLHGFLRPEMKFNSIEELKAQMKRDIEAGFRR
ncbi:MAG: bifunctional riboflavin kinase/FAD synthetase [Lachnospiraceae bacterium]|nr:bifunctional riboflavin kinase/FAD synthetase [Lachnospiraceae bacterium]